MVGIVIARQRMRGGGTFSDEPDAWLVANAAALCSRKG